MDIANNSRPRRPWIALLISLVAPGLGHVYNGDLRGGIVRYAVVMSGFSAALAVWPYLVPSVGALVIGLMVANAIVVGVAVTAYRQSRQVPASAPRLWYSRWYGLLGLFLLTAFVFSAFKASSEYFAKPYHIPNLSMFPTLAIGDDIYVTNLSYGVKLPFTDRVLVRFHPPERGDVIVFKYPEDESKDFIKRVVGIPGDVVEVRDKDLYVNGAALAETSYIQHIDPAIHFDRRDNFGPVTVPDHSYFVMGDNRDQSLDSRFWGFVQENKIRGKAVLIYWSWNRDESRVRRDRIGRRL